MSHKAHPPEISTAIFRKQKMQEAKSTQAQFDLFCEQQRVEIKQALVELQAKFDWSKIDRLLQQAQQKGGELESSDVSGLGDEVLSTLTQFAQGEYLAAVTDLGNLASTQRFQKVLDLTNFRGTKEDALNLNTDELWAICGSAGIHREMAVQASAAASQILYSDRRTSAVVLLEQEVQRRHTAARSGWLKVGGKECQVLQCIDVLWSGWECDDKAWLVNVDGQRTLVVTNHGQQVIGSDAEKLLKDRLCAYRESLQQTELLLREAC